MRNKPDALKMAWMAEKRYLAGLVSGIVHRKVRIVETDDETVIACTDGNTVFINPQHMIYGKMKELLSSKKPGAERLRRNLKGKRHKAGSEAEYKEASRIVKMGIVTHEALHQVFTNFDYADKFVDALRKTGDIRYEYEEMVLHNIMNLIEDPAIETFAPQVIGGTALKALYFTITAIDELTSEDIGREKSPYGEVVTAMIEFGDTGVVRDNFTHPEAKEAFRKIAPLFYDAINEPDNIERVRAAWPIFLELKPLWQDKDREEMEDFIKQVKDAFEKCLKNGTLPGGGSKKGTGKNAKTESGDATANANRKITLKKMKREEYEELKKQQEEAGPENHGGGDVIALPEDFNEEDAKEIIENMNNSDDDNGATMDIPLPMPAGKGESKDSEASGDGSDSSESEEETATENGKEETTSESGKSKTGSETPETGKDAKAGTDSKPEKAGKKAEESESSSEGKESGAGDQKSGKKASDETGTESKGASGTEADDESADSSGTSEETGKGGSETGASTEETDSGSESSGTGSSGEETGEDGSDGSSEGVSGSKPEDGESSSGETGDSSKGAPGMDTENVSEGTDGASEGTEGEKTDPGECPEEAGSRKGSSGTASTGEEPGEEGHDGSECSDGSSEGESNGEETGSTAGTDGSDSESGSSAEDSEAECSDGETGSTEAGDTASAGETSDGGAECELPGNSVVEETETPGADDSASGEAASPSDEMSDAGSSSTESGAECTDGAPTEKGSEDETGNAEYEGFDPAARTGGSMEYDEEFDGEFVEDDESTAFDDAELDSILNGINRETENLTREYEELDDYFEPIESYADEISKFPKFERVPVKNAFIEDLDDSCEAAYDEIAESINEYTEPFKEDIQELFDADRVRKEYSETGSRVNLMRVSLKKGARVFERRTLPGHRDDVCFCLVVDNSGSTRGEKNQQEKIACIGIAEALAELEIPLYVFGFTVEYDCCREYVKQVHYIRWENSRRERENILRMKAEGGNFDSYSIRYATQLLEERPERNKVMFILSDGYPTDGFDTMEEGVIQNALAINDARKEGITVLGIAVGTDIEETVFKRMYGEDYVMVENPAELFDNISEKMEEAIAEGAD